MFNGCYKLKDIKGINKLISKNVIDMEGMFQSCKEIEYLDLTNFDTSNIVSMCGMFNGCYKLKKIEGINNLNTKKTENVSSMFNNCISLEYLDLSNLIHLKLLKSKECLIIVLN